MIVRQFLLGAFVFSVAGSAYALDSRLRTQLFDPEQVVRIVGRPGIQSTIEFGNDERIENVAVGDSSAWQVTPNRRGSAIFLKPLSSVGVTNMTVVTDRRTYLFDLVAGGKDVTPLYSLKFTYPVLAPEVSETVVSVAQGAITTDAHNASAPLAAPERLNFNWKVKGAKSLQPTRVFDDGSALFIGWDSRAPLPAVLSIAEGGEEGPLHYTVAGEYIVVKPLPALVVLRYGKYDAELRRLHPLPTRALPPSPVEEPRHSAVAVAQVGNSARVTPPAEMSPNHSSPSPALGKLEPVRVADLLTDNLTGGHR